MSSKAEEPELVDDTDPFEPFREQLDKLPAIEDLREKWKLAGYSHTDPAFILLDLYENVQARFETLYRVDHQQRQKALFAQADALDAFNEQIAAVRSLKEKMEGLHEDCMAVQEQCVLVHEVNEAYVPALAEASSSVAGAVEKVSQVATKRTFLYFLSYGLVFVAAYMLAMVSFALF